MLFFGSRRACLDILAGLNYGYMVMIIPLVVLRNFCVTSWMLGQGLKLNQVKVRVRLLIIWTSSSMYNKQLPASGAETLVSYLQRVQLTVEGRMSFTAMILYGRLISHALA